jgi:hypothetical protein
MMGLGFISFENAFMTHTYIPFACYHAAMRDDLKQDWKYPMRPALASLYPFAIY